MTLADRIVVLDRGNIEQIGTPEEIYETPASQFVAAFIGAPPMNLMAGQFDGASVVLPGGRRLALPARATAARTRDVVLGIRPEHLEWIAADDPRAAVIGDAAVVEPLGSDTLVSLDIAGANLIARLPPRRVRRAGERVALTVDPAHVHFFDPATQRRI
jgi:ABC-type sugar transport system ATPase subunit